MRFGSVKNLEQVQFFAIALNFHYLCTRINRAVGHFLMAMKREILMTNDHNRRKLLKTMTAIISVIIVFSCSFASMAQQRRVSPVKKSTNKVMTAEQNKAKVEELKQIGLVMLGDSIVTDSVAASLNDSIKDRSMKYPLLTSLTIGANLWDPIMRLFGQTYGGMDFSAELSLWNRINPVVEVGFGSAKNTPEEMNFTYKGNFALYGKIGCNYNFTYNSKPEYLALLGFRLGYSNFKYSITDVTMNPGYWNENANFDILDQKSHALWGELSLNLRIKLIDNLSAGWSFKYHFLFNYKKNPTSEPWYIPGYGSRTSPISAAFSIYYTLPFNKDRWPEDKKEKNAYTGEPIDSPGPGTSTPIEIPGPGSPRTR